MNQRRALHVVQGGIENGDEAWLEKAARLGLRSAPIWVVPKAAAVGDDVVIFIGGYGFFATAKIASPTRPRKGWRNRYGAALARIRLIRPAISLSTIQRRVPDLEWANYPRSITTPAAKVARKILALIAERRRTHMPDLSDAALESANLDELRRVALLRATPSAAMRSAARSYRVRSKAIRLYVLGRANGTCEGCRASAPFVRADRSPYLEPHHITRLADAGPDHPAKVIGLCPNCHRRAHHAADAKTFNRRLSRTSRRLEERAGRRAQPARRRR